MGRPGELRIGRSGGRGPLCGLAPEPCSRGEQEGHSGERPGDQDRDVPSRGGAVEVPGAAEQVATGPGWHQLTDRPGWLWQQLWSRADAGERVADEDHGQPTHDRSRCAEQRVKADDDRRDCQNGECQRRGIGQPATFDDVEPALHDHGGNEAAEDGAGDEQPGADQAAGREPHRGRGEEDACENQWQDGSRQGRATWGGHHVLHLDGLGSRRRGDLACGASQ